MLALDGPVQGIRTTRRTIDLDHGQRDSKINHAGLPLCSTSRKAVGDCVYQEELS